MRHASIAAPIGTTGYGTAAFANGGFPGGGDSTLGVGWRVRETERWNAGGAVVASVDLTSAAGMPTDRQRSWPGGFLVAECRVPRPVEAMIDPNRETPVVIPAVQAAVDGHRAVRAGGRLIGEGGAPCLDVDTAGFGQTLARAKARAKSKAAPEGRTLAIAGLSADPGVDVHCDG